MARFYTNSRTEVDLREELDNFLDGFFPEISKKQRFLLRKMRRTSSGLLIPCSCVDIVTKEPDLDTFCSVCHGEGYYWDEILIDGYSSEIKSDVGKAVKENLTSPGNLNISLKKFFIRYNVDITEQDRIIELVLDRDGNIVNPPRRKKLYEINTLMALRSDYGRIEFYKADVHYQQRKFLNGVNK